jgi:hypothetical protein
VPKLKASEFNFDEDELEGAEYNEDFGDYTGEEPPASIILSGHIKKLWLSESEKEGVKSDMLIVLFVADENEGDYEKYNGWPTFDYQVLKTTTKFKWKPFFDAIGITVRDVKNKMYTADEPENMGDVVEKIGTWQPGPDNDGAWVRVLTKRELYNGAYQAKVQKFLPWEDAEEAPAAPEPAPAKAASRRPAAAKPAAAKPAPASRRAAKPAPVEEPEEEEGEEYDEGEEPEEAVEETPTPASSRRGRGPTAASTAKPAAKAPARSSARTRRGSGSTEEPPF